MSLLAVLFKIRLLEEGGGRGGVGENSLFEIKDFIIEPSVTVVPS